MVSGTYEEEKLLELVAHVEAATGMTARIIGTRPALRKVTSAVMSDAAKDSYYNAVSYTHLAEINIPSESIPIIFLGGRFVIATQVFPTSSSGW